MVRNTVMFVVEVMSLLTIGFWIQALMGRGEAPAEFIGQISLWLWFTVLFANYAEVLAEGRGKAQAEALRRMRKQIQAKKLPKGYLEESHGKPKDSEYSLASSTELRKGDLYFVETGDILAADGEIVERIASVDESAVTGESAPVIREDRGC
jgi:K+-transporting ATPase ATPase B chain